LVVSGSWCINSSSLNPHHEIVNHSPDGFEWGYSGSGPAQLAFALCYDALDGDQERAVKVYQRFKDRVVSTLSRHGFQLNKTFVRLIIEQIENNVGVFADPSGVRFEQESS